MSGVRAFVGHSFSPNDEEVVRKFLDYFTQLAKSSLNFSWMHARGAEPKDLAVKVLGLINEANTFIGICTKKEQILVEELPARSGFFQKLMSGPSIKTEWKTSDWVIQEIGLAKGRNLDIIILLEDGVRKPGGLQGNLEYIVFERDHPEKSFGKLVEMISALDPKSVSAAVGAPEQKESDAGAIRDSGTDVEKFWTPQIGWKRTDYERALFFAILLENRDGEQKICDAFRGEYSSGDEGEIASWNARYELLLIKHSDRGKLQKLEAIAADHPNNIEVGRRVAEAYTFLEEYDKATICYERVASVAQDPIEQCQVLARAAVYSARDGNLQKASELIDRLRGSSPVQEDVVLEALRDIAEFQKDDKSYVAICERLSELRPNDFELTFSLAYKYSMVGHNALSLHHYRRIPVGERKHMAWNNLGVSLSRQSMPAKAVEAWKRSKAMGGTLAMSNLANTLIEAGFLKEAEEECRAAMKEEDFDKNVSISLAKLQEVPAEEDSKLTELIEEIKPSSQFYRAVGRAMCQPSVSSLPIYWVGPKCELQVRLEGEKFSAMGSYEIPSIGQGLFANAFGQNLPPLRTNVEYKGIVRGHAIYGIVTRKNEREMPSLLGNGLAEKEFVMVLGADSDEIRVMEPAPKKGEFYTLRPKIN